ncbi:MAG TPA: hypothetical protein VI814_11980 [Candidatus Limnocylindria bacterium]
MLPIATTFDVIARRTLLRTIAIDTPRAATTAAIALGVAVRFFPVVTSDFPVNDGGMFYTIVQDIERAHLGFPQHLSYNGLDLPFAYAPLSFYLATLVNLVGVPLLDVFRFLPAVLASLILFAFVRFARRATKDDVLTAIATVGFALVPSAYASHITGGGLPRALGVLFLLLALERFIVLFETRSRAALVGAGVFGALALLSHTEMGWALAFSTVVLWLLRARDRRSFIDAVGAALVAGAVAAPWLVTVLLRYGPAPFLSAFSTGTLDNPAVKLAIFDQTGEPWFPLFAALAIVGIVRVLGQRRWWLPAWILAIGLLDSRSLHILSAIPMAILAAIAVREVLAPLVTSRRISIALAAAAIAYGLITTPWALPDVLRTIPTTDRTAMSWVKDNTPPDARFLVVTERGWAENSVGEWFPALAERPSVSTVQGWEWVPDRAFWKQMVSFFAAQSCGSQDSGCLDRLRADTGYVFSYVYIPSEKLMQRQDHSAEPCCTPLRMSLERDPRYELVYSEGGAYIFRARQ